MDGAIFEPERGSFSIRSRKNKDFRGVVLSYVAQGNPQFDEEIAKKYPFRPEIKNPAHGAGRVLGREGRSSYSGRKLGKKGGWPKRLASRGRYSVIRFPGSLPITRKYNIADGALVVQRDEVIIYRPDGAETN